MVLRSFLSGTTLNHYAYGTRAIREEVKQRFVDSAGALTAVITQNSYGSLVLSTARVMFVDIDFAPVIPGEALGYFFKRLFNKVVPKPEARREHDARQRLDDFLADNRQWRLRMYRTCAGLRLLATHALFDPAADETQSLLESLGSDPMYIRLCKAQESFRARLTPKPWRCGHVSNTTAWPRRPTSKSATSTNGCQSIWSASPVSPPASTSATPVTGRRWPRSSPSSPSMTGRRAVRKHCPWLSDPRWQFVLSETSTFMSTDVWYFAYGSNLSRLVKLRNGTIRPARVACLRGYRFALNKRGSRGEVYANVMPSPGDVVWGVIYLCDGPTMASLDRYEGVETGDYLRQPLAVETSDGETLPAEVYLAGESFLTSTGRPTPAYLRQIISGADHHGLPEEYVREIERLVG